MFIGTGSSISYSSSFFAEILNIGGPSMNRKSIESSHMGTTNDHTFDPGKLVDGGSINVEMAFIPNTTIPIHTAKEAIVITFADSGTTTFSFQGFMTDFEPSTNLEERATASATIKISGAVTQA